MRWIEYAVVPLRNQTGLMYGPTASFLMGEPRHGRRYLEVMGRLGPYPVYGPVSARRVREQSLMTRIRGRLERPKRVLPLPT